MNGVRSIFRRKGYLLTALAAAVLLAASSGTAWAQVEPGSVRFTATTGTVSEGAPTSTKPPLLVTLERTLRTVRGVDDDDDASRLFTIVRGSEPAGLIGDSGLTITGMRGAMVVDNALTFNMNTTEAVLSIVPPDNDADWDSETFYVALTHTDGAVEIGPRLEVTVEDDDAQPVVSFSSPSVRLTEGSRALVDVKIGKARGERRPLPDLSEAGGSVSIVVDPPGAIEDDRDGYSVIDIEVTVGTTTMDLDVVGVDDRGANNAFGGVAAGVYTLGTIQELAPDDAGVAQKITLTISANKDKADFRNHDITVSFHPKTMTVKAGDEEAAATLGQLMDGGSLAIMTDSDESVPTVSFSPTNVDVMEGGSVTSTLLATGEFGADVGMVKLSVEGHAMVGLYMGMDKLEEMDGYVMVDLGDTNAAKLTAKSYSDPDLMDGEMKSKTWKIMEADGADIDQDASWLTVTVEGSTAVPALPLIGQLLLALFLMAGGARLYRRRQG